MSRGDLQEMEVKTAQSKTAVNSGAKAGEPMDSSQAGSYEDLGGPSPENYKPDDDSAKLKEPKIKTVADVVNKGAKSADAMQKMSKEETETTEEVVAEEEVSTEEVVAELEETTEDLEFSELDIDELDVEYLVDVLDIIDSADLFDTLGEFDIKGAARGFNEESQYNVYLQDGDLVLYRNVNGLIRIKFGAGGSFTLATNTPTWNGDIYGNDGEDIYIYINQQN